MAAADREAKEVAFGKKLEGNKQEMNDNVTRLEGLISKAG